jgi:hypothetical protein
LFIIDHAPTAPQLPDKAAASFKIYFEAIGQLFPNKELLLFLLEGNFFLAGFPTRTPLYANARDETG